MMKNLIILAVCVFAATVWPATHAGADGTEWRKVGAFRSNGRNVAVAPGKIRLITQIDLIPLELSGDYLVDSGIVERAYPGWNYKDDLIIWYTAFPTGYRQTSFDYGLGADRDSLVGDPVAPNLGIFDHSGKKRAEVPEEVGKSIGIRRDIVAAIRGNVDDDPELEWVVVTATGGWDERGITTAVQLHIVDRVDGQWSMIQSFEIAEKTRSGPLEIRDVTGDGKPDIVYRTFSETMGHIWITAHIYTDTVGMSLMNRTPVFRPEIRGEG